MILKSIIEGIFFTGLWISIILLFQSSVKKKMSFTYYSLKHSSLQIPIYFYRSKIKNLMQVGLFNCKEIFISDSLSSEFILLDNLIPHEIAHIKLKHFDWYILLMLINNIILFFSWHLSIELIGIQNMILQFLIFIILYSSTGFIGAFISRQFEYQADEYAVKHFNLNINSYITSLIALDPGKRRIMFNHHPTIEQRGNNLKEFMKYKITIPGDDYLNYYSSE